MRDRPTTSQQRCRRCTERLPGSAAFCPICGAKAEPHRDVAARLPLRAQARPQAVPLRTARVPGRVVGLAIGLAVIAGGLLIEELALDPASSAAPPAAAALAIGLGVAGLALAVVGAVLLFLAVRRVPAALDCRRCGREVAARRAAFGLLCQAGHYARIDWIAAVLTAVFWASVTAGAVGILTLWAC